MLYIWDMHIFELLTLVVNKTNSTMQLLNHLLREVRYNWEYLRIRKKEYRDCVYVFGVVMMQLCQIQ